MYINTLKKTYSMTYTTTWYSAAKVDIRNFSPHFRNIADHRIDCEIAD